MNKLKKILISLIILILVGLIGIYGLSYYVGINLTARNKEYYNINEYPLNEKYEEVIFDSDGLKLAGVYFNANSTKTIIVEHGYQNDYTMKGSTNKIVNYFVNKGYNVFAFDFRASGRSEGDVISVGVYEKKDSINAINFLDENYPFEELYIIGFSMGAAVALETSLDQRVDGVIADSPFNDLTKYLEANLSVWSGLPSFPFNKTVKQIMTIAYGIDTNNVSALKHLKNVKTPILLIHGNNDTAIPIKNSQEIFTMIKDNNDLNRLWETTSEHVETINDQEAAFMNEVELFIESIQNQPK